MRRSSPSQVDGEVAVALATDGGAPPPFAARTVPLPIASRWGGFIVLSRKFGREIPLPPAGGEKHFVSRVRYMPPAEVKGR